MWIQPLLLACLLVAACAPRDTARDRYEAAFLAHPIDFRVPADSTSIIADRLPTFYMSDRNYPPQLISSGAVVETEEEVGDSTLFWLSVSYKNRQPTTADTLFLHELSLFMRTGLTIEDFE